MRCVEGISLDDGASIAPVTKMVAADDIKDSESLERWREEWPKSQKMDEEAARKVAVSIARRSAMCVFPFALEAYSSEISGKRELTTFWFFFNGV